jgi:hypothetical protein
MIDKLITVRHTLSETSLNPALHIFWGCIGLAVMVVVFWAIATLRYRITDRAVEVLIFGRCARRIRLDDIEHVRRGSAFWNEHWTNFKLWNCVTLRRKSGCCRNFVITPDDPNGFVAELARKLEHLK